MIAHNLLNTKRDRSADANADTDRNSDADADTDIHRYVYNRCRYSAGTDLSVCLIIHAT